MSEQRRADLVLDFFAAGDAAVLCEIDHDPEHRRRFEIPRDFVPSRTHSEAVVARWGRERGAGVRYPYAVRDARSRELLGGCELRPAGGAVAQISYWTHPRHRGRGVASEAVRQACRLAFTEYGFVRIELETDADNLPSQRVAIRNGFKQLGQRDGRVLFVLDAQAVQT